MYIFLLTFTVYNLILVRNILSHRNYIASTASRLSVPN